MMKRARHLHAGVCKTSATLIAIGASVGCSAGPTADGTAAAPESRTPGQPQAAHGAIVELPLRASDAMVIRDAASGISARVSLDAARADAEVEVEGDLTLYRGAAPGGADVALRVLPDGVEDFVSFHERPARAELSYTLEPLGASGLRLVGRVLELLDASGTPRLRMAAPWIADRGGRRHDVGVALRGCDADRDPRGPWGRDVTPPGGVRCGVVLSWPEGIAYPAVLDPLWTLTRKMTSPRETHLSTRLPDGRVLLAGGRPSYFSADTTDSAELFDPTTATFAATGSMTTPRRLHLQALAGTHVLVAGGCTKTVDPTDPMCGEVQATAEVYSIATGTWSATAPMSGPRSGGGAAVRLEGERAMVIGGNVAPGSGELATTEIYDVASGTWTAAASMAAARQAFGTAEVLVAGKPVVLVAAGVAEGVQLDSSELYDPALDAWVSAGSLSSVRSRLSLTSLADGGALLVGGIKNGAPLDLVERFDPATREWTVVSSMSYGRHSHAAVPLLDGRVLVAGGCCELAFSKAELFDPASETWTMLPEMPSDGRWRGTADTLIDGRVILTGGDTFSTTSPFDDALLFTLGAAGSSCTASSECASGFCASGVCCDAACDGACVSCSATAKGGGADGVCEPVAAGAEDPAGICAPQDEGSCGTTGRCGAAAACEVYAIGARCTATCENGTVAGACDGAGTCVCPGLVCSGNELLSLDGELSKDCTPYLCEGDRCKTSCDSSDDCIATQLCDEQQRCVPAQTPGESSGDETGGGCACRVAGGERSGAGGVALLALAAMAWMRRRRD